MKKSWFTITNKSDAEAEISIYEEIGMWGITAKDFLEEMKSVGDRKIKLRINSPGGEVFEGLAIYNRLSEHAPGVEVCIDGIAASMASVIAMVGEPVTMAANALMMMHNPSGLCIGNAEDMRDLADMLDKLRGSLTGAYEKKTGKTTAEISAMMDAETWLNADEAKAGGFIDEITGALKIAAHFDKLKFEGKLAAREKLIDAPSEESNNEANPMAEPKTPAELELDKINAKKVADEQAAAEKKLTGDAVTAERKRVADIQALASAITANHNIDVSDAEKSHIADGKSCAEFQTFVLENKFKAKKFATTTDHNGADGKTMPRAEFTKMSPLNQRDFCLKGGRITEPKLKLVEVAE